MLAAFVVTALAATACSTGGNSQRNSATATGEPPQKAASPSQKGAVVRINVTVDGTTLEADIEDSRTARDFVAQLPLTLTLTDFHQTEKISDLPAELSTVGAPAGTAARAGDLAYYAPWGNLAVFYRDSGYATGLIKLGHIDSGIDVVAEQSNDFTVTIEAAG